MLWMDDRTVRASGHPCVQKGGKDMTLGTAVVGGVLFVVITGIVASMVRDKKAGKSLQCGGDCSKCRGGCH